MDACIGYAIERMGIVGPTTTTLLVGGHFPYPKGPELRFMFSAGHALDFPSAYFPPEARSRLLRMLPFTARPSAACAAFLIGQFSTSPWWGWPDVLRHR